jgi:phosphoribosylformylglycinamidine synthase
MLGVVDDVERLTTTVGFKDAGDQVVLLSPGSWIHRDDIGGSEYLSVVHGMTAGDAPHFVLEEEVAVQNACRTAIEGGFIASAHDVSDGGLAVCLAECVMPRGAPGVRIDLATRGDVRLDALLFGEAQSRIVVSVAEADVESLRDIAARYGVTATVIGVVTDGPLAIAVGGQNIIEIGKNALLEVYEGAIPAYMS